MKKKDLKFKNNVRILALIVLGVITIGTGTTVLASTTWKANTPESIKIVEGQNSSTMVEGDTLWAIGMKINVNIKTLAVVNNINLSNGEEYHLKIGTVIRWDRVGNLTAETSEGKQINEGVELKDSNKIISTKPIGADVTSDVQSKGISDEQIIGDEDITVNPAKPETPTPVEPEVPVKPETPAPVEPEVPVKPETPAPVNQKFQQNQKIRLILTK
ncbi:hypothetical protein DOK78_000315 [Enterococcus sp. DIV2402]|uniref:LysM domain-containing protein n=1 Tax=Candidatus Enterococcus lowellii TaxID=2230877 RepID=A0ABZ2SPC8_9ENTE|nr:LysM peptidoglycan-binding domain-containing protein [Enterococcus sp. DIV2402]MBO0464802.1 LysM peptidoglycan-binding domain-containing protein [Enterococcus sp. DIV2402]